MMKLNCIPFSMKDLVKLGVKAEAGTETYGPAAGIVLNTNDRVATTLYDLIGDPATPLVPGKQAILNTRNQELKTARLALGAATDAGCEYCRLGISLLKGVLGTRHNSAWFAAGFLTPSLAVPKDPVPMLIEFRHYFTANAARENASGGITAAQAQAKMADIQAAQLGLASAEAAQAQAKGARNFAKRALSERLSGLRSELDQLLSDQDFRWREFGFRRPADGHIPSDVEGLVLTAGAPGTVVVRWDRAALAENYRVLWRPAGAEFETATEVGLFGDLQMLISGLTTGTSVIVSVTARNNSGETQPTESTITVP